MQTRLSLIADHPGNYDGISANFSGEGFSDMKFKAIAMSRQAFDDWVAKAKQSPKALDFTSYGALAAPAQKHAVEYFSPVDVALFQHVLKGAQEHRTHTAMSAPEPVGLGREE